MKRSDVGLRMLVLAAGLIYTASTFGQAPKSTTADRAAAAGGAAKSAESPSANSASVTGRLPRYFGQLMLDEGQRSKIYSIQHKYRARLRALQQQLEKLRAEQGQEIQQVLSATQRERLGTLLSRPPKRTRGAKKGTGGKPPTGQSPKAAAGQVTTTP